MSLDDFKNVMNDLSKNDYEEKAGECSWDDFKRVVTSRRSVRVYDKTKVPESVIHEAIDMALIAPTSSNLQQTEFYWVRTPALREKLVTYCLSQPAAATAAELIVVVARTDTWRRNAAAVIRQLKDSGAPRAAISYYERLVPLAYGRGPLGLLNLAKRVYFRFKGMYSITPREPRSTADLRVWAHKSAALAAENFMLAIRAKGYDSCPMEGHDSHRVKCLIGLPRGAEVNMVISVGRRASSGVYGPRMRLERKLFVFEL